MQPIRAVVALALSAQSTMLDGYHPMPNGMWYHESCIHQFEQDFSLDLTTSTVNLANGTAVTHGACAHQPLDAATASGQGSVASGEGNVASGEGNVASGEGNVGYYSDWAAYAQYPHAAGLGFMSSDWVVPKKPESKGPAPPLVSSSIYLFNGLEDGMGTRNNASVILQPVMQYGKSGCLHCASGKCNDWYFTSYAVDGSGRAFCGKNIGPLAEGERVTGNMTLQDAPTNKWLIESARDKDGQTSSATVTLGSNITLNTAYLTTEAMVIYSCKAYPESGNVTFGANVLSDRAGTAVTPTWKPLIRHDECSQSVAMDGDAVVISWDPTRPPNATAVA
jgi:hypothetical protein